MLINILCPFLKIRKLKLIHRLTECEIKIPHFFQHVMKYQLTNYALFFPLFLNRDQNLLTWTDSAIYIFTPHNGHVLLWTELKGTLNTQSCEY